jgi:hypothetical protein
MLSFVGMGSDKEKVETIGLDGDGVVKSALVDLYLLTPPILP